MSRNVPYSTVKRKRDGGETGRGRELPRDFMAWRTASRTTDAEQYPLCGQYCYKENGKEGGHLRCSHCF